MCEYLYSNLTRNGGKNATENVLSSQVKNRGGIMLFSDQNGTMFLNVLYYLVLERVWGSMLIDCWCESKCCRTFKEGSLAIRQKSLVAYKL